MYVNAFRGATTGQKLRRTYIFTCPLLPTPHLPTSPIPHRSPTCRQYLFFLPVRVSLFVNRHIIERSENDEKYAHFSASWL